MLDGFSYGWGQVMRFRRTPVCLPAGPYGFDVRRMRRYAGSSVPLGFVIISAAVGAVLGGFTGFLSMGQGSSTHWMLMFMSTFVFGAAPGAMVGFAIGRLVGGFRQSRRGPR